MSDKVYYITKYALTDGIRELRGAVVNERESLVKNSSRFIGSWDTRSHTYAPGEYHETFEAAVAKAEQMRTRKIAALKKSIAKMECLSFVSGGLIND